VCERCGVEDWAALRRALGLTQSEMAEATMQSLRTVQRHERPGHRCNSRAPAKHLLLLVQQRPKYQERLRAAGIAWS
jgi:DNA-binding transcriptional regulator YiaG